MAVRRVRVRSFAKINLDLRVLHKRPDNYHELRSVFQTVSLADAITIEYEKTRRTSITLTGNVNIPNNLIERAARAVLDQARAAATLHFTLQKRIPMGGGLGGGSTNAAAILLALPALLGKRVDVKRIAASLGSDVPFFLHGGTALGLGRGEELYPLPDLPALPGVLISPAIHVSTPDAYKDLNRTLTIATDDVDTVKFQSVVWGMGNERPVQDWKTLSENHFEAAVFNRHPQLHQIKRRLQRVGASPALMTGSGSAIFGLFESKGLRDKAATVLRTQLTEGEQVHSITLVTRRRYQSTWLRSLQEHVEETLWPPRSRYAS